MLFPNVIRIECDTVKDKYIQLLPIVASCNVMLIKLLNVLIFQLQIFEKSPVTIF